MRSTGRELVVGWEHAAWIVRANGSGDRPLPAEGGYQIPLWSPRGTELAYAWNPPGLDRAKGIYVLPRDGGPLRVSGGSLDAVGDPLWSPRGSLIAYGQDSRDTGKDGLYVVRRDGSQRRRVLALPDRRRVDEGIRHGSVSWSPDERSITYTRDEWAKNPPSVAFVVDVASGRRTRLGQGRAMFSPRGRLIVVHGGPDGHGGGQAKTVVGTRIDEFVWSLDANRIAYTRQDGLWVVAVANPRPRRVLRWSLPGGQSRGPLIWR